MPREEPASRVRIELQGKQEVSVRWSNPEHLDPMYADNLHLTRLNDQYYLTFGQLRPSFTDVGQGVPVTAEIRPMVRLMISKEALKQIVALLNKSIEKMPEGR